MITTIRYSQLHNLYPNDLTLEEMIYVHLDLHTVTIKDRILLSTLSVLQRNINSGLTNEYSKTLMPVLSMLAILDQLGICYNRKDKPAPAVGNGLKRCLYYFGEFNENDDLINSLYALRNGLMHSISLCSYDKFKGLYYYFIFDDSLPSVFRNATTAWDGDYNNLDGSNGEYATPISIPNLKRLVDNCIQKASELNKSSQLELRLLGGIKQLYFDYIKYKMKNTVGNNT